MNELTRQAENVHNEPPSVAPLDAQLTELIEFVWACEAAARREERIDAAYGSNWRSRSRRSHTPSPAPPDGHLRRRHEPSHRDELTRGRGGGLMAAE